MLPFVLGRLKRNYEMMANLGDPVDALHRLYVDTVLHDARVLTFLAEIIGTDRLMMGSDMPFPIGDREPTKIVDEAGFKGEKANSINGGLAIRLFRIPQRTGNV